MTRTLNAWVGIAGNNGIESFIPAHTVSDENLSTMMLRCQFNTQRDLLLYRVFMYEDQGETVEKYLGKHKWKQALIYIKENAREVQIANKSFGKERQWNNIPTLTQDEAKDRFFMALEDIEKPIPEKQKQLELGDF